MNEQRPVPVGVDPLVPSPARIYDYLLGGSYNFAADREVAERGLARVPELRDVILANRGFHGRAAHWLATRGIDQFLDIGSGLPTVGNTHDVVRAVRPGARVVYADIDPMVAACAADLLTEPATTRVVLGDLRDPDALLDSPDVRELIDLSQPVGLLMTAVLHFVADASDPWALVRRYLDALAPGSYLAMSHATYDNLPEQAVQVGRDEYQRATEQFYYRSRAEIERFFTGLELVPPHPGVPPSLAYMGEWGAESVALADSDGSRWGYCGVGRKP